MSSEDAAIAKLDQAITRLESVLSKLPDSSGGDAARELEDENRRLSDALKSARKEHSALESRVEEVNGRLDHVIAELRSVLES
jgi:ElaB/YqjD/DUF883 family membrane-anchored ribosome-binding protein